MSDADQKDVDEFLEDIFSDPSYTKIWNHTRNFDESEEQDLIHAYRTNRSLDQPYFSLFICAYILLAGIGSVGNCLVITSVIRKPTMRTARNLFIINLAASDLLLCVITMPLTCMELLSKYWPLPSSVLICKIVGSLQAVSVFVSTISITAIALDRYQVIVYIFTVSSTLLPTMWRID